MICLIKSEWDYPLFCACFCMSCFVYFFFLVCLAVVDPRHGERKNWSNNILWGWRLHLGNPRSATVQSQLSDWLGWTQDLAKTSGSFVISSIWFVCQWSHMSHDLPFVLLFVSCCFVIVLRRLTHFIKHILLLKCPEKLPEQKQKDQQSTRSTHNEQTIEFTDSD